MRRWEIQRKLDSQKEMVSLFTIKKSNISLINRHTIYQFDYANQQPIDHLN